MKKSQFLVVAILAAVVMLAVFAVCIDYGKTPNDWSTVSSYTREAPNCRLPDLSGSVAPSSTSAPEDQTDNTTATFTSSGAVRASFTVLPQPEGNQEESVAAKGQAMPNNQAYAAAQPHPEQGGLPLIWVLLLAAFSMGITAFAVVAFRHVHAGKQARALGETGESP